MQNGRPAEVFRPGEYVLDELESRGWTQADLAEIMGRPPKLISEVVSGLTSITPETARGLAEAFGTSAELWMNMQAAYNLHAVHSTGEVARKARLYLWGPIGEMVRRGWIEPSSSIEVLEQRVMRFYETTTLDEPPSPIRASARKSASETGYSETTPAQTAWLYRARQMARAAYAGPFDRESLDRALKALRSMMVNPEDVRLVPKVLADAGVRFVVVKHLTGTKIDGYCFWLDESSPVIAVSMRYDRIDGFWFTLLHEIRHVMKGHSSIDVLLVGKGATETVGKPEAEQDADRFAEEFEIDQAQLDSLINRVHPLYSKQKIEGFSARQNVHPGIVIGQLQHRGKIGYSHSRQMLVPVREIVTASALTDGWGDQSPPLS